MSENDTPRGAPDARDGLGELIRAAGRRHAPPRGHHADVRAAAHDAWQATVRARRRRRSYGLVASLGAAAGVVGAVVGVLYLDAPAAATLTRVEGRVEVASVRDPAWRPLAAPGAQLKRGDRVRTSAAGGAAFSFGAASVLRVAGGTELAIADTHALELASGTLYVDSQGEPMEIVTALGRVRDIGTQFEVHRAGDRHRVRVRSGRVAVIDSPLASDVEASAGAELELEGSGRLERREIAPDAASWAWAAALALPPPGRDTVLGYLEWIARETGKSLDFESPGAELRAGIVRWRGDPSGLTPAQILDAIAATSDFDYELTDDGGILIRQR